MEVEGAQERGIVVFTLQQLPDGQPFYFDHKSRLTIARMGDNLYAINGAPPPSAPSWSWSWSYLRSKGGLARSSPHFSLAPAPPSPLPTPPL